MKKFVTYDDRYEMHRLNLAYSLGDLDTVRMIFCRNTIDSSVSLPVLPPQLDQIHENGERGYLVFPPVEMADRIDVFMEKTITHIRELKGKGYDYNHPDFKRYLEARDEIIIYLAERLESIIEQERRLGIFNLFWLVVTAICVDGLNRSLVKLNASVNTRFAVQPHIRSMLKQTLAQVNEKLNYRDELLRKTMPFYKSTIMTRLGASFNFNFVNDMLDIQLCLLENNIPPVDPLHFIRKLLVEENSLYLITYEDFEVMYHSIKSWVEDKISRRDEWFIGIISHVLGISTENLAKIGSDIIVFDPRFIFTLQEKFRSIPAVIRTKTLRKKQLGEEIDSKAYDHLVIDYLKLARELQVAEIITFFRKKIKLIGEMDVVVGVSGKKAQTLENKITYNLDIGSVISDLRNNTIMFVDLRASTELSSGTISSSQLIKTLYAFFDPALDIIEHYGGRIRFFAGDSILATFSDDNPKEYSTFNAVLAGIEIQKMLARSDIDDQMPLKGVGIGIHVGMLESAYIFSDKREKFDTVIGLAANLASRLSSGKSSSRERKADPLFRREINDLLQDILENTKNRISPNVRDDIVNLFEAFSREDSVPGGSKKAFQILPEIKDKAGSFKVNVINGFLHNNGVALSSAALSNLSDNQALQERSWRDSTEFVAFDTKNDPIFVLRPVGDAHLKGIPETIMVWSALPVDNA
ncbi:MAG: adenylate/guanylate cyclase domain-containing protein [bacterium]